MKKKYISLLLFMFLLNSTQINTFNFNNKYIKYNNSNDIVKECEYSQEYIEWLKLSEEDKAIYDMPGVCKTEDTNGILPDYDPSGFIGSLEDTTIPSKYDSRNVNGENFVTSVRSQESTGTCWSFAGHASIESSILKNYKEEYPYDLSTLDFADLHTAYSTSQKHFLDGNNPKGFNTRVAGSGGNIWKVAAYISRLDGPVFESSFPFYDYYDETEDSSKPSTDNYQLKKINLSELEKPVVADVNDIIWNRTSSKCTDAKKNVIKKLIMENGSVEASYYHDSAYANGAYIYYNGGTTTNHAISIVGWDDTISKTKFKAGKQPTTDGAFIIKNSWGEKKCYTIDYYIEGHIERGTITAADVPTLEAKIAFIESRNGVVNEEKTECCFSRGDNGYYYISYEDYNICNTIAAYRDIDFEVEENAYYHDTLGYERAISVGNTNNVAWAANKFKKQTNNKELLKEITMATPASTNYEVYISYEDDLSNKKLLGSGKIAHEGYGTYKLTEPIVIDKDFSILVKFELTNTSSKNVLAVQSNRITQYANTILEEDQSYFSTDGETWTDFTTQSYKYVPSIKAFTNNIDYDFVLGEVKQPDLTQDLFNIPITLTNISDLTKFDIKILDSNDIEVTSEFNITNDGNNIGIEKKYISTSNGDYKVIVNYDLITEETTIEVTNSNPTIILGDINYKPNTIYNDESDKIYNNTGGKITIPITSYHLTNNTLNIEITNILDDVIEYEYSGNILNNGRTDLTITIPENSNAGVYSLKIYNDEVERITNFTIFEFIRVDDIIFKYGEIELEKITLIKDDTIKIRGEISNANSTSKDITWSIENPSDLEVAQLNSDGTIRGINSGIANLVAKVGIQGFKIPITIIEKPNITLTEFEISSNVLGNSSIDNYFGGTLKTYVTTQNITSEMNIENSILTNDDEIILEGYIIEQEANKDIIKINSLPNEGTHKYVKRVNVNDTKGTKLEFFKTFDIENYVALETINIDKEKIFIKLDETYKLNNTFTPINATNKIINYIIEDTSILTIDENGIITPLKEGSTTIKVVSNYNELIYDLVTINVIKDNYINFTDKIKILVEENNNYLKGMLELETYKELKNNINTNLDVILKDINDNIITDETTILKTNQKLYIGDNLYYIVIKGDLNGDGKMSITDLSQMRYHLAVVSGKIKTGAYEQAGDMNNSNTLTITDLSRMRKELAN